MPDRRRAPRADRRRARPRRPRRRRPRAATPSLLAAHDARREARPAHHAHRRLHRHRPRRRRATSTPTPRRPGRQPLQPLGPRGGPRRPAHRRRGDPPRHPALLRPRRHPRLPHHLPDPARRGRRLRPRALGGDRPRCRRRGAAAAGLDLTFAPMLDVARDPRWGRIAEGPGEDPYVAARFAEAKVRGFQGTDLAGLAATAQALRRLRRQRRRPRLRRRRHLRPRARRDLPAAVPRRRRRRRRRDHAGLHRPRRRAADRQPRAAHRHPARATGASTASSSATTAPSASSIRHGVAADLARGRRAGAERRRRHRHDVAAPTEPACREALDRGLVTDGSHRRRRRPRARAQGPPRPLRRPLPPLHRPRPRDAGPPRARRAAARDAATRSIVLLQNRDGALPLPDAPGRIALIGPLADAAGEMLGPWAGAGRGDEAVSVLAGLRAALPDADIDHVAGVRRSRAATPPASPRPSPRPRAPTTSSSASARPPG